MSANVAMKAAKENIEQYLDEKADPARVNENIALFNLARAIEGIERELRDLKAAVYSLQNRH